MKDNQHFVSKAYLDKFVHPSSRQKVLYPYAKGNGAQRPRGTRQLASADCFYLQNEGGRWTNKLDEVRKALESLFFASGKRTPGPLARRVFDDGFVPSSSDKVVLAGVAAFLRCGSPVQIHNAAMFELLVQQIELFNRLNTNEVRDHYEKLYGDHAEERLEEARDAIWKGKVFVDVGEENWRQLGFSSLQTQEFWLDGLCELTVCASHPGSCFITSDNPVVLTSHLQKDSPGMGLRDAEVWFPVSHYRGLLWTWKHTGISKTTLGHSETRVRNRQVIKWSYQEVYSPLPEDWLSAATKECNFDPCHGYYGSLERIVNDGLSTVSDGQGRKEIVDLLAALRDAERREVVRLCRR